MKFLVNDEKKLVIEGGRPLTGQVRISGSKNASVAAIPAALLAEGPSVLENVPDIVDVRIFADILTNLGAVVSYDRDEQTMTIDPNGFLTPVAPHSLVRRLRASYYLLGVLLSKFGTAEVAMPGGCDIGIRPVDQHIKGMKALGAEVVLEHGVIKAKTKGVSLSGKEIYLDVVSVGATINLMLASVFAGGVTTIENAAKEPHVVDLANYLNAMGARVQGAGTDTIRIRGVKELRGTRHSLIPDDTEAGTYLLAGVATGGDITVKDVISKHLEPLLAKIAEMGAFIEDREDAVRVIARGRPKSVNAITRPYPGFPTDLQQPLIAVMATAENVSLIQESMYDNRFGFINELVKMGANVRVDGRTAIVEGVDHLMGSPVTAHDLRAGAALLVAALSARGVTEIYGIEHLDRGYERIEEKVSGLGGCIARVC